MPSKDLADDRFWVTAFDQRAPFYDSYVKYFRRALLEKNPSVLDVHREAIYYITDEALAPIVANLIKIATAHPDYGFVESLAFFLSREDQKERLMVAFSNNIAAENNAEIKDDINSLCAALLEAGDDDLVEEFSKFLAMLGP